MDFGRRDRFHDFAFTFDGVQQLIRYCDCAKHFEAWTEELITQATQEPNDISVNIAMLLLLRKYWEWYVSVPKNHQNHIGTRNHHRCIFQVFKDAYFRLHALALSLTPPRLFEPPPPEPEPTQTIAGIFIGVDEEGDGDEEEV